MEAVCLASGPSLIQEDIETVRQWRERTGGLVYVTNTTFRSALWADVLFSMDGRWWRVYALEAKATFKGDLVTSSQSYKSYGITFSRHLTFGNTGAGMVNLAFHRGARKILLLGYDAQLTNGKVHHHGDHPKPLCNALSYPHWPGQFERLAQALKGKVEIINCSRETALKCFPKMSLEDVIEANTRGDGVRGQSLPAIGCAALS